MNCTQCGAPTQSNICSYCSSVLSGNMPLGLERIGKYAINWDNVAVVDLSWNDRVFLIGESGRVIIGIRDGMEILKKRFGGWDEHRQL